MAIRQLLRDEELWKMSVLCIFFILARGIAINLSKEWIALILSRAQVKVPPRDPLRHLFWSFSVRF
jgi:hypothetical protein